MARAFRRVITEDDGGRGRIRVEEQLPGNTFRPVADCFVADLWSLDGLPREGRDGDVPQAYALEPKPGEIVFRLCQIPSEYQILHDLAKAGRVAEIPGDLTEFGMHQTATIDFVTIVAGTVNLRIGDQEILLEAGDTVVQRGTKHAWRNKSDTPCIISVVMVGTTRESDQT